MKILLYSANFAPEPTGIGKYSGEMVEWLTSQGHEVRVVCAPPYYPDWRLAEGYRWPMYRHEEMLGARVWRAPLWVPQHPSGLKRVVHLLSFALTSLPVMLRQAFWRPDVVVTVAPAFVCAPAGWLTARLSGGKAWLHVQDFEVDVAFGMGLLKGGWLRRSVLAAERLLMRRFDVVSSISGRMVERLHAKGVPVERTHLFPNWVNVEHIRPLQGCSPYREELGIAPDAKVVLYSGTLGNKHGLCILPKAANMLRHRKDIVFVICGDGVMKRELQHACRDMENVRMLPLQPAERLCDLLGMADIHLLPQSAEAEDLVLPSKINGMLSSGRPVIATCNPESELGRVVARCGLVTPPGNAMAMASAIVQLADAPTDRSDLGGKARRYAEQRLSINGILSSFCARAGRLSNQPEPVENVSVIERLDLGSVFPPAQRDVANLNK